MNNFRIQAIKLLTTQDSEGRRYFRTWPSDGWRRLKSPEAFEQLNYGIDQTTEKYFGRSVAIGTNSER